MFVFHTTLLLLRVLSALVKSRSFWTILDSVLRRSAPTKLLICFQKHARTAPCVCDAHTAATCTGVSGSLWKSFHSFEHSTRLIRFRAFDFGAQTCRRDTHILTHTHEWRERARLFPNFIGFHAHAQTTPPLHTCAHVAHVTSPSLHFISTHVCVCVSVFVRKHAFECVTLVCSVCIRIAHSTVALRWRWVSQWRSGRLCVWVAFCVSISVRSYAHGFVLCVDRVSAFSRKRRDCANINSHHVYNRHQQPSNPPTTTKNHPANIHERQSGLRRR